MQRSQINQILAQSAAFVERHGFVLPAFAFWSPEEMVRRTKPGSSILSGRLGWDVTDYGKGDFKKRGLVLFALRNCASGDQDGEAGYAEKLMICANGQSCQLHRHKAKSGDIINRGGGTLILRVYNSLPNGELDDQSSVTTNADGEQLTTDAGAPIRLKPGASITLPAGFWHVFSAENDDVLVGEVSTLNNDHNDNFFREPISRFLTVDEDTRPTQLLVSDYENWLR